MGGLDTELYSHCKEERISAHDIEGVKRYFGAMAQHSTETLEHSLRVALSGYHTLPARYRSHFMIQQMLVGLARHDEGKLDVRADYLDGRPLELAQVEEVRVHPTTGYFRLRDAAPMYAPLAGCHHYPQGIGIPIAQALAELPDEYRDHRDELLVAIQHGSIIDHIDAALHRRTRDYSIHGSKPLDAALHEKYGISLRNAQRILAQVKHAQLRLAA